MTDVSSLASGGARRTGPRPPLGARRMPARRHEAARDDGGFSLVEVAVAVAVLLAIIIPVTLLIYDGQVASTTLALRAEATNLAAKSIDTALYEAAHGTAPNSGSTTSTVKIGSDEFTISLAFDVRAEAGAGTSAADSVCANGTPTGGASQTSDIFTATATVTWGTSKGDKIVQTTNLAPPSAVFANPNSTELALQLNYFTGQSLPSAALLTAYLSCSSGTSACQSDAPYETSGSAKNDPSGCIVFNNVAAVQGNTYTISLEGNAGWVDDNQNSDAQTAPGYPTSTASSLTPDGVTIMPSLTVAVGTTTGMCFSVVGGGACSYSGSGNPNNDRPPRTALPITVASSSATTALYGSSGFDTASGKVTDALLFPVTSQSSSQSYSAWAGSGDYSSPALYAQTGDSASFQAYTGQSASATVVLFPAELTIQGNALTSLTATELGSSAANEPPIQLNLGGGGTTSDTLLPLGMYQLTATTSSGPDTTLADPYMWVTPTGVCTYSASSEPTVDPSIGGKCQGGSTQTAPAPALPATINT